MHYNFRRQHVVMLLKYSGISFISGAVNHGFFSGERSLWTAATGVLLFVLGLWAEHRNADVGGGRESVWTTVLWGTLLSVGLGFFTGGLQHFPDSPERSAWVVPLGFAVSVLAMLIQQRTRITRPVASYVAVAGLLVCIGSAGAWQWLVQDPAGSLAHHHGEEPAANTPVAQVVNRTIEVNMVDAMRFLPGAIKVQAGETVRIVARNDGQLPHELVIGTESELREHANQMRQGSGHAHHAGAAVTVAPGKVGELVVTYRRPEQLQIACLVPGHFEAGMRGEFEVVAQLADPQPAAAPPTAKARKSANHDHSTHKH
ncbi:cupredoxin family protein [Ramlibacter henchirensis]|nr:cupredoxin family protein [Ramlibacter henchirensis]